MSNNDDVHRLRSLIENFAEAISRSIDESDPVLETFQKIRDAGFNVLCAIEIRFAIEKLGAGQTSTAHQPLVQDDGKVTPGTFSSRDVTDLKTLRITLDEK